MLKNVRSRFDDALTKISWQDFERIFADYYREQGYKVEHTGTANNHKLYDGGIDLKLYKDDQFILVQCKHWNAKQVPHNDVHQLIGIMVNESATGSILITSGEFTGAAKLAANKQGHVQLIDGEVLREMLGSRLTLLVDKAVDAGSVKRRVQTPGGIDNHVPSRASKSADFETYSSNRKHRRSSKAISGKYFLVKISAMVVAVLIMFNVTRCSSNRLFHQLSAPMPNVTTNPPAKAPAETIPQRPARANVTTTVDSVSADPYGTDAKLKAMADKKTLEKWKRENAESMKIIEASTPELKK